MLRRLTRIAFKAIKDIHVFATSLFLVAVFLSMFFQVLLRYVFNNPSPELYEITHFSFAWAVLLGAAFTHRFRAHVKFNIIYEKFPRRAQLVVDLIFDLFITVLFGLSLPTALHQALWYYMIRSEVFRIPWTYVVLCLPIFLVLVILHNLIFIFQEVRELFTGKPMSLEDKPWA